MALARGLVQALSRLKMSPVLQGVVVRGGAIGVHREVVRAFHASPAACGGRRGGASALLKKSKRRKKKKRRKDDDKNKPFNPYTMMLKPRFKKGEMEMLQNMSEEELFDPEFAEFMEEATRQLEHPRSNEEKLLEADPARRSRDMLFYEATKGEFCSVLQYNKLIRMYGAHGRLDDAVKVFRDMVERGVAADEQTLTALVWAAGRVRNPKAAEELIEEADPLGLKPDPWTWSALINAYVRAGQLEGALDAFKRMKLGGFPQDVAVCTAVLQALGRMGDREALTRFWVDMRLHNVEPDAVAYVIMTHAYAKSGDIEKALSLLDEMEHFKLLPTVYNYNAVLLAAAKAPLWFPGYKDILYEGLGRLNGSNLKPNAHTFQCLLRICARAGNPIMAERYIALMRTEGVELRREHYHELIRAYAMGASAGTKGGMIPRLLDVEGKNRRTPFLEPLPDGVHIRDIHGRKGKGGKWVLPKARFMGPRMGTTEAQAKLAQLEGKAAQGEGEGQQEEGVENLLELLPSASYSTVPGAIPGGVLELLPEEERNKVQFNGIVPIFEERARVDFVRQRLPGDIKTPQLQEHYISAAHAVVQEMRQQGLAPDVQTMNHLLDVHSEALRVNRSIALLENGFLAEGLKPNDRSYHSIIRMLLRARRLSRAVDMVRDMLDKGPVKPNDETMGMMVEQLGRHGKLKPALYMLEVMCLDLKYKPKEWHVKPLRRLMNKLKISHPCMPPDPLAWLKKGIAMGMKKQGKEQARITRFVLSKSFGKGGIP